MYWWPFIVDGVEQTQIKSRQNGIHLDSILGAQASVGPFTNHWQRAVDNAVFNCSSSWSTSRCSDVLRDSCKQDRQRMCFFSNWDNSNEILIVSVLMPAKTLVNALVVSRLDYCNGLLIGLPDKQLNRPQAVMNAAARLIYRGRWYSHITHLLHDQLHWLRSRERVSFKICVMVYEALHDVAASYIKELCVLVTTNTRRTSLRSATDGQLVVPKTSTKAGNRSFAVAGPQAWSKLPAYGRQSPSL